MRGILIAVWALGVLGPWGPAAAQHLGGRVEPGHVQPRLEERDQRASRATGGLQSGPAEIPDALQVELGYGLVALADTRKGGDLLARVTGVLAAAALIGGAVLSGANPAVAQGTYVMPSPQSGTDSLRR